VGIAIQFDVPLAPLTTLELGGPARFFARAESETAVSEALAFAQGRGLPVFVLGGGSNLVVADAGFPGLVLQVALPGLAFHDAGGETLLEAGAGQPWDALVDQAVARDLAGVECLAGIPGFVGATPIQNVGAYGQEVSETIRRVRALDRKTLQVVEVEPAACGFGYRDSAFKRAPDRHLVLAVSFALRPGGPPTVRYPELRAALPAEPSLTQVRDTVRRLRAGKSMLLSPDDENRRSAGSFFMNPLVAPAEADRIAAQAVSEGLVKDVAQVPRFPAAGGQVKLAAGWLIERAGIARGYRQGPVGVSSKHALALVHHGGGSTAQLLALARHVRDAVAARFGVRLVPEPVLLGTSLDAQS
jgi:UDP-N-acetylmuramate dehydrogenase